MPTAEENNSAGLKSCRGPGGRRAAVLDTGAPAALRRVAAEELAAHEAAEIALAALTEDAEDGKARAAYLNALDRWYRAVRTLRDLDKSVVPERRSAEVVPQAEAREIVAQVVLSVRLAVESALLGACQEAAVCHGEAGFAAAVGPRVRAALEEALASALREGAVPKWALQA